MSNGEKYHKDSLTCAHAKYALGTLLKVTNIKNGKSVVVEVTKKDDYPPAWRKKK